MKYAVSAFLLAAVAVVIGLSAINWGSGPKSSLYEPVRMGPMEPVGALQSESSATAPANVPPATVTLEVKSDEEHAKKGPEGTWHDAYLPADFTVSPGQRVTVHIYNYDEGKHSFTSPMLGVNVNVAGGSEKTPKETSFTFTAPSKPGAYEWFCDYPCDPWAMARQGFMQGKVTVS